MFRDVAMILKLHSTHRRLDEREKEKARDRESIRVGCSQAGVKRKETRRKNDKGVLGELGFSST